MSEAADIGAGGQAAASAGELLRRAREAAGLHIAALAVSLKVPVRKLEALEADRWDELPDPVFARALAGSMCRALKVDARPVLALLPRAVPTNLREDSTLEGSSLPGSPPVVWSAGYRLLLRPPGIWVLLLLLGALVLAFWPKAPTQAPGAAEVSSLPVPAAQPQSGSAAPATETVADVPASSTQAAASLPAATGTAAPASSAAGTPIVSFRAKATTWVEVVDARQVVVLRRTLAAGETAAAEGQMPLAVVIGRVDATEVMVRGQRFDLSAATRDNVARFEVK